MEEEGEPAVKNPREDLSRYKVGDAVECRPDGSASQSWYTGKVLKCCVCAEKDKTETKLSVHVDRLGYTVEFTDRSWEHIRKPGEWFHGEAVEFRTFPDGPQSLSEGVWHRGTIVDEAQGYCRWRTVRRDGPYGEINVEVENIRYPQPAPPQPKWQPGDIVEFMMNASWVTGAIAKSASFASWEVRRDGTNYIVYETYVRKPTPGPTALDVAELKAKIKAAEDDRDDAKRWLAEERKQGEAWRQKYLGAVELNKKSVSSWREDADRERLRAEKAEHQVKQLEARLDGIKRCL